MVNQQYV